MKRHLKSLFVIILLLILVSCNIITQQLPDPLEAGWEGESVCDVIENNKDLRVLKCTFPPKAGHEFHYHNPHFGYTLKGSRFRIKDSSGVREVKVPTGYTFSKNHLSTHEVLNIGDSTAVFLIMEYR